MKQKKFLLTAYGIDATTIVLSLAVLIVIVLTSLQADLLASYGTFEVEQAQDLTYASLGSTASIAVSVFIFLFFTVFLSFIADTIKVYLVKPKNAKRVWLVNILIWIVFLIALVISGFILAEVYLFFALFTLLKSIFYIIATLSFGFLLFGVLLVGKKRYWYKGADWKLHAKLWLIGYVMSGILFATTTKLGIVIGVVTILGLYNYTLHCFTHRK